jgi:hypothetical protein
MHNTVTHRIAYDNPYDYAEAQADADYRADRQRHTPPPSPSSPAAATKRSPWCSPARCTSSITPTPWSTAIAIPVCSTP